MSSTIDPSKLKVTELREELQSRGLDIKGNKPVLVKRLKKALEEELNKELPDTSIADTSTEDLDSSKIDENEENDENKVEENDKQITEQKESVDSVVSQENEPEQEVDNEEEQQNNQHDEVDDKTTNGEENVTNDEVNEEATEDNEELNEENEEANEETEKQNNEETKENKQEVVEEDNKDVEMKTEETQKREKRKRSQESPERSQRRREKSPIREDEPEIDENKVLLSWYDSDLSLLIDKKNLISAKPIHDGNFGYAWAGARATHGISKGKVYYEVKLTEELKWEDFLNQRRERLEKAKERRDKEKSTTRKEEKPKEIENDENKQQETEETVIKTENDNDVKEEPTDEPLEKMETDEVKTETEVKEEIKTEDEVKKEANEEENKVDEEKQEEKMETNEETKENEEKVVEEKTEIPSLTHIFRIGWSLTDTSLQLGEDEFSYAYESTGKFVSNKIFTDFGESFKLGDVVGAYLNITEESIEMKFTLNGELQKETYTIQTSELPENFVLYPHVLSRNYVFELNFGNREEQWFASPENMEDYQFIQLNDDKIQGIKRPEKREDCEVIMMCGLPGSGKTYWVNEHLKANPDKKVTVISCSKLLDKMTVHGKPLKPLYTGRWNLFVDKLYRCLNRLCDIAQRRRRNYIIDQTNVVPSDQRRKMRDFEGFKKRAVVVIVGDEEYAKRLESMPKEQQQDGKDAEANYILELKASMTIPSKGELFDEVEFTNLNEEDAKTQVAKYNSEGKAAGYHPGQRRSYDYRSQYRNNRNRLNRRDDYRGNRDRDYHRYGGSGGGGGGGRGPRGWGQPPPQPHGRYPRDRRSLPPPPPSRDWMRNNRGPPRSSGDRNGRDRSNYRNSRHSGSDRSNWQSNSYGSGSGGGGNWSQQPSGNWGGQGWSNWNTNQWKQNSYGGQQQQQPSSYGQQQNWNNYYSQQQQQPTQQQQQQYAQNWGQQS